jgi:hypothetical protein
MQNSFSNWLNLNEAKADKIIVYHGTSYKNLSSILSQGLIPNPKQRAWSEDPNTGFYQASRQSLEGIYVSTNLGTASGAATNAKNREDMKNGSVIVVCEIQPKTAFLDEDDLMMLDRFNNNEYQLADLFCLIIKDPTDEFVRLQFENFVELFKRMTSEYEGMDNPQLIASLHDSLWNFFKKSIQRKVAYIEDYTFSKKLRDYKINVEKPNATISEREFLQAKDVLTKSLKKMANPYNLKNRNEYSRFTSRINSPIRFSGVNKIIAIVHKPFDYKERPRVVYGQVPEDFVKQYREAIGDWNPIS